MGVVFVIVWELCCYCRGVVFVIVWGLCHCVGVVFLIVIFVWLLKFNNIVWDEFGEVWVWSFVRC